MSSPLSNFEESIKLEADKMGAVVAAALIHRFLNEETQLDKFNKLRSPSPQEINGEEDWENHSALDKACRPIKAFGKFIFQTYLPAALDDFILIHGQAKKFITTVAYTTHGELYSLYEL